MFCASRMGQGSLFQNTPILDGKAMVPGLFIVSIFFRGVGTRSHEERARQSDGVVRVRVGRSVANAFGDGGNGDVAALGQPIFLGSGEGISHFVAGEVGAVARGAGLLAPRLSERAG